MLNTEFKRCSRKACFAYLIRQSKLCRYVILFVVFSSPSLASPQRLTILHFNDFHGHIEQAAKITAKVNEIEEEIFTRCMRSSTGHACGEVIVLNGGDLISGTPASKMSNGAAETAFLNHLKVKESEVMGVRTAGRRDMAMVIGNHDFDFGLLALKANMSNSKFPIISANIHEKETGKPFAAPFVILSPKIGMDIAVFGLTHDATPFLTNPKNVAKLTFGRPIPAARKIMAELEKKTDIQIALTHEGVKKDIELAKKVKGIDVIVGGHDHVKPNEYCRTVGQVPVCQTPANGRYLGRIDLEIEEGKVKKADYALIPIDDSIKEDKKTAALMKPYLKAADAEMKKIAGVVSGEYRHEKGRSSRLAELVAEAMRDYTGADFGIINAGGVRKGLKKGKVTNGDIYEMLPFDNVVLKIRMKGRDIQNLLKYSKARGGFLQLSGLDYNTHLDSNKNYTVATVDFLADGGGGCTDFKKGEVILNTGEYIRDIFTGFIRERGL